MPGPIQLPDRDLYINTPLQRCYSESPRSMRPLMDHQQRDYVLKHVIASGHVPFHSKDIVDTTSSFKQNAPSSIDTDYVISYGDEDACADVTCNEVSPSSQEIVHALTISPRVIRPVPFWFRLSIAILLSAFVCGILLYPSQTILFALTFAHIVIVAMINYQLISKCAFVSSDIRHNSLSWLHMRCFIFRRNKFPEYFCSTASKNHVIPLVDTLQSLSSGSPRFSVHARRLVHATDFGYALLTLVPTMLFHLCFDCILIVSQLFVIYLNICEYIERYRKQVVSRLWFDIHKRGGSIHPDRLRELSLRCHAIITMFPNSILRQLEIILRPIVHITGATIMPVKAKQFVNVLNQHVEFFWDSDYTSESPLRDLYNSKTPISSASHLS